MKPFPIKFLLIVLMGVSILISGCNPSASEDLPTPTPIPTPIVPTKPTYEVLLGEITNELQFNGRIAPVTEEGLFFRTGGRVRNVYFEKSSEVEAGQVIADLELLDNLERQYEADTLALRRAEIYVENANYILDLFKLSAPSPDLQEAIARQAVAEAEKAIADAERAYYITKSTASQADIDAAFAQIVLAEKPLEKAKEAFEPYENKPEDNLIRAQLQTRLSAAQRAYDSAVRNYNSMAGTGSIPDQTLAASELATAKAKLSDALQNLEVVLLGSSLNLELSLKENDLELAQIGLEESRLGIQDLEQAIADAQLTVPFNGTIFSLGVSDGKTVDAYNIYAVVADLTNLEISADLTGKDLMDLEEGMRVTTVFANRPGEEYNGYIRRLPYLGSTSTTGEDEDKSTRISLDEDITDAGLEVGDLMRITVVLEHKENVLWLPPQAIRTFEGRKFVVVQDGEFQARVDVKIGIESNDRVEILEGLEEGQIVIGP